MKKVQLQSSKSPFIFGNCAMLAIGGAFDIPLKAMKAIFKLFHIHNEGPTFFECKKIIYFLAKSYGWKVEYIPNPDITYAQLGQLFPNDLFIVDTGPHLSLLENGVVYDSFLENSDKYKIEKVIPTGWWKINKNVNSINITYSYGYRR